MMGNGLQRVQVLPLQNISACGSTPGIKVSHEPGEAGEPLKGSPLLIPSHRAHIYPQWVLSALSHLGSEPVIILHVFCLKT